MMMGKHSIGRAIALGSIALVVLCAFAPTPVHRSDNFNNNVLASFWDQGHDGNLRVREFHQRLEFRTVGPTSLDAAGVAFNPYGINWKQDFHIEFDYRLSIPGNIGASRVLLGAVLELFGDFPNITGVVAGVMRQGNTLFLGAFTFNNGVITDIDGIAITQTGGRIQVDWDKSADRLTIRRGGQTAHLDGMFANWGGAFGNSPMAIVLGCLVQNSGVNFNGNKAYIDNWEADFVKRLFP